MSDSHWNASADPIADLRAAIAAVREQTYEPSGDLTPYLRSAHLPAGQMYVMGPALTGHDRDVLIIPTGPAGDRILAALQEMGRLPILWRQTPEESARATARALDGTPPMFDPPTPMRGLTGWPVIEPVVSDRPNITITGV